MSSASTVARSWARSHTKTVSVSAPSAPVRKPIKMRMHDRQVAAAMLFAPVYPRGRKILGVSSQEISSIRNTGGCIGKTAALMEADPDHALLIATHLSAVARAVTARETLDECIKSVLLRKGEADGEEDRARERVLVQQDVESVRDLLRAAKREKAELQRTIDRAERWLQEHGG